MTRPLIYDDQFTSLVRSNKKEKFLFCITMKVQSTAFYQTLSLQNSLRICSIYDLIFAIGTLVVSGLSLSLVEIILVVFCVIFFIISLNTSNNLNKEYSMYYYYWRVIITIFIPIREFFNYNSTKICYYLDLCNTFTFYISITVGMTIIHLYFTKISWSFWKRLQLGQELLIIHGKYLEKMLNLENSKLNNLNKYVPPSATNKNESEFINFGNSGTVLEMNSFAPKN